MHTLDYGYQTVPVKESSEIENGKLKAVLSSYDSSLQIHYEDSQGPLYSERIELQYFGIGLNE